MGVIKKFNPETGQWEIYGSTDAKDINLIDAGNNFSDKSVEGALREISNKLTKTTADLRAHSATLVEHTSNIAWLKENGGGGGGGGGGSAAPTITSTFADGTIVNKDEEVKIPIFFTSPNLGEGTAYVMIDNVEVAIIPGIKQGNNTIEIGKLANLTNHVSIYVKDRINMLSNQLNWTIISGGIDLEVLFDDTADYYITDMIMMQFDVTSASKEPIIMHMTIDYDEYEIECENGFNEYIFPELGIGIHQVSFYITSGPYSTPVQYYNIVIVSSNSLYVSSSFKGGDFTVGTPIPIQYRISKASKEEFTVNMYLNGKLKKTAVCQPGTYYWTLNDLDIDDYEVKIEIIGAYDDPQTLELEFSVISSGYEPVKITEQGLQYRLSARGRTNQDYDREFPIDDSGNGITATLHNFNFFTNGWIDDELVCDSNAYVEIDFKPWENNAIYGSTIEVQFSSIDIGLTDARIFDYTDITPPYKGVFIDIEESIMSSIANEGKVSVDKDTDTTLSFVIDRRNKFGKVFVNGICTRAFFLSDTGSGVNAVREDFTHSQKIYINSKKGESQFGACKVKDVRIYGRVLSDDEIVQNYIAQERDLAKQEKLYNFNYNNTTLPVIRMYGDTTNMTLETPVTMRIKYTSPSEDLYGQSFDLPYCQVNWQGTSSLQYVLKNFTARLRDENMAVYDYTPYRNGIPEDTYCFKADYMESTHSRNVGIAKFVNDCLYDEKNPMQLKNPNIRNTVNGFPCLMYINDELQGVYNFNLDRYSTKSYGYTDESTLVYEVSANSDTTAGAFYKWTEESGKDKLSYYKSDFECLYPPTRAAGNDNMSELIRLIEWVNDSSDEDFKDNFEKYFNKQYVLRYYLFVLIFGAVDSLGKNMKLATWDGLVWYPQVYDADTTIGLDNTGFLKFDMDIEMGDEGVFNTTGSKLWKRIVFLFQEELKKEYALMRQDRFTVDNIMKYLYGEQISQIPAVYYNKDMQTKYLDWGSSYLYALHGSGEQHIRRWIRERIIYIDSLLGYMVDFDKDKITLRSSKLGYVYLDIETYIPMYVSVKWRDEANNTGMQTKRVGRGEVVRFEYNMPTATDQEILVYAGYYLKRLGNVSNLEPTTMLIANAKRLTEIECHSKNLINTDLSQCTLLQRIDISNCTALGTGIGAESTLNIESCKYLRYCDCRGTKLTAIYTMQAGGNLEEIYFPETTQIIRLTNQTYLRVCGIPFGNLYCRSLAQVTMSNCHRIEYIHYPFEEGESLNFESMKYVQHLDLSNSLDKLTELNFRGFNKLTSVTLSSMHNLTTLGFDDMLQTIDEPTLESVKVSDCPSIDKVTFNLTSDSNKIAFAANSVIDISGMQSVHTIEGNAPIQGLKTLIVPNSVKYILFDYVYGNGRTSDIKNIWSSLVNHTTDGYEGIDLKGVNLIHINLDAFKNIVKGKNFHIAPIDMNPKFNISRDNVEYPYIDLEGSIDLTQYVGDMSYLFKGLDMTKFKVQVSGNRPQEILTGLFSEAIVKSTKDLKSKDLVNGLLGCYPYADVWDGLFKYADIDFDTDDIQIPNKYMSTADMYRGTSITKDIDMPSTMINVDSMFRDCKQLKTYLMNWKKDEQDFFDPDMIKRGCYFNSGGDLELVPPEWGGYGFYPEVTSEIIVYIPYENYSLQLCNKFTTLSIGVVSWGDGEVTFVEEDKYIHKYKQPGRYTIKGHFTFGPGSESRENSSYFSPSESLRNALEEVVYLAKDTTDLCQAFKYCRNLKKANIGGLKVTSLAETFSGCSMLSELNYPGTSFSGLTEIHGAFQTCESLTEIDLSNFNTEKVADFTGVFYGCKLLESINVSGFNTANATSMAEMFRECEALKSINLSNFNTSKVKNMYNMFRNCKALTALDLSNFNTSNVETMANMFRNSAIIELDLSNFDTGKVVDMTEMFSDMTALTTLNISSFDTKNVKTMEEMFNRCSALTSLDLTHFDMSNVENMTYMFSNDGNLEELKLGTFDVRKVKDMKYLFSGCSKLTELDMSGFITEAVTNIESMFINCGGLTSLSFPKFNTKNVYTMRDIFSGCRSLTSLDISTFDTTNVEDMGGMFWNCASLTSINLDKFNTGKVRRMDGMFKYCRDLTSINLKNFNTSSLEDMYGMFSECYNLKTCDISSFVSTNVLYAAELFSYCQQLETIELGELTFNLVADMQKMFMGCYSIKTLDLSKFNTFSVSNMNNMFAGCNALSTLTIGDKFTTKYVTDFNNMFSGTFSLADFDVSGFDFSEATNMERMFENCLFNVNLANKNLSNVSNMSRIFKEYKGTSIDMTNCDIGNSVDNIEFIYSCPSLTNFIPPLNITSSMHVYANELPAEAFINTINNLATVTEPQILSIGDVNMAKISEDVIATAVSKNWSVA